MGMNIKINEEVLYVLVRAAKHQGGRWVISIPCEYIVQVKDKIVETEKTKELKFRIYITKNKKIILEAI
jgi:hypothetical protein